VIHGAADAAAGVVAAQRYRVDAVDDPRFGPVQVVGAGFVADPVDVGVPEGAGVQGDDAPSGAGEPLGEGAAAGADADDDGVDLVVVLWVVARRRRCGRRRLRRRRRTGGG
jgi:hypothetical protein